MRTILARGGIEFLAVFLGIALSLWVDDFREDRELKERLNDDLIKIYNEVQANTANIETIIGLNKKYLSYEEELLKILNKEIVFSFNEAIELISNIKKFLEIYHNYDIYDYKKNYLDDLVSQKTKIYNLVSSLNVRYSDKDDDVWTRGEDI